MQRYFPSARNRLGEDRLEFNILVSRLPSQEMSRMEHAEVEVILPRERILTPARLKLAPPSASLGILAHHVTMRRHGAGDAEG